MRCPACAADNREGRRFCRECGRPLGTVCPACRFTNEPGDRFCGGCGVPVNPAGAAAMVAAHGKAGPLESYIPKHLAEKILTSKSALEGERKQVTVLFADLKGSMELLADRDPEEARAILDPVLERMMEAVHRYEGTVNQVMGDGIMALFGAPLAHEDHAVRACYAALRMQESVKRYAEEAQRRVGAVIQIRVGLNSGEVVVRSIGSDLKMDYSAVGQTTHLAARMEQTAMPGSALLTGEVVRLVQGFVQVKPLGPVNVKGLATPVDVYELLGAGQVRTRLQAAAHGLTPFVGRERELAELEGALADAAAGQGCGVALAGDPGVGKSRLVYELTNSPAAAGWLVLESAALSYGRSTPYLPVLDLLRGYFQIDERDDAWKIREKVTTRLLALHRPLERLLPAFLSLLEIAVGDPDWQTLDPPQRRWRTLDALERLLIRESERQPVLVVIEDVHWADSETEAFVDRLVEALPSSRMLLLVNYRPDYVDGRVGKNRYVHLRVEPLRPAAARALADTLLGNNPELEPLKERLIGQTQGNPLFLKESVATLVETGALVGERGAYRPTRATQTMQVPSTVHAVLAARIDRLPPEEKRLLQTASVVGTHIPFSLLYALAELPEETLRQHVLNLERAEFLDETDQFPNLAYSLKHVLTQEVAYASLLHERRRALHARVVEVLEALSPEGVVDQVERLAYHAFRGEVWDKAVRYYRQAAIKATARSANLESVECFEKALAALQRLPEGREKVEQAIDLRLELRPTLLQLGRLDELLAVSQEAETLAQQLGDEPRVARVCTYLINYHYLRGEPAVAVDYGERCLAIAERTRDESLAALTERYLGLIAHVQGDYRRAADLLKQSIGRLEAVRENDVNATVSYVAATGWRAFTLAELGDFDEAYALLDRAQHAADASRHAYSQAIAYTLQGLVWLRQGHLERGVAPLERALQLCTEKALAVWQPIPSSLLGSVLVLLERKDDGLRLLEDGVTLTEGLGVSAYLSLWTTHLAGGLLAAGQPERARALAAQALELAKRHGERGHQAWALRLLGQISARGTTADRETALDRYREALALANELEMRPLIAQCHLGLGRLYRQAGNRQKAEEHLTDATARFWETDMRRWLKQAEIELADLGHLFIVGRNNPRLYDHLKQEFASDEKVRVILDRRAGERQLRGTLGVFPTN